METDYLVRADLVGREGVGGLGAVILAGAVVAEGTLTAEGAIKLLEFVRVTDAEGAGLGIAVLFASFKNLLGFPNSH